MQALRAKNREGTLPQTKQSQTLRHAIAGCLKYCQAVARHAYGEIFVFYLRLAGGNTLIACASRSSKPGARVVHLEDSPDAQVIWRMMEPFKNRETTALKAILNG